MRIPRIFTPQQLTSGQNIMMEDAPSHHLSRVLRMQPGRELILFNGRGGEFCAQILALHKKQVEVCVGKFSAEDRQSPLRLELAIGLSKGERMDWILQKATELGVTRVTPLHTERSEIKLSGERLSKKMEHWEQILISACEQCQRNILPALAAPMALSNWLAQCHAQRKFVMHHRSGQGLAETDAVTEAALVIGPEGGLSEWEIDQALASGCQPLTLGPRVLRTETAPLAAISLVQYLWGDMR